MYSKAPLSWSKGPRATEPNLPLPGFGPWSVELLRPLRAVHVQQGPLFESALSAVTFLVDRGGLCAVGSLVAPAAWVRLPLPGLGPRKAQDPNPNGCKKEAVETKTATDKAVKTETIALILCLLISFVSFLVCRPFGPF